MLKCYSFLDMLSLLWLLLVDEYCRYNMQIPYTWREGLPRCAQVAVVDCNLCGPRDFQCRIQLHQSERATIENDAI